MAQNFVKVAQLGGKVQEVCLDDKATVQDAIDAAEIDLEGMEIKVNNRPAELESEVFNRDLVILIPKVEGGL